MINKIQVINNIAYGENQSNAKVDFIGINNNLYLSNEILFNNELTDVLLYNEWEYKGGD